MVLLWNASKLQPTEATLSKQILVFLVYVSNKGVSIYIEAPFMFMHNYSYNHIFLHKTIDFLYNRVHNNRHS